MTPLLIKEMSPRRGVLEGRLISAAAGPLFTVWTPDASRDALLVHLDALARRVGVTVVASVVEGGLRVWRSSPAAPAEGAAA